MKTDNTPEYSISSEFDDQILTERISHEILNLEGVSRLTYSGITENVTKNVLKIDPTAQGIKLTKEDDDSLIVNVHIVVFYGYNIPQLSYDIQSKVKNLLEEMTGAEVKAVNIFVDGIDRARG